MSKTKPDAKKQAQAAAKKAFASAKAKFNAAEREVNKHIHKDPAKALMIAAGVGAAIGAVTMLALSRKKR
ncbi:MAG: hypothetical protein PHQ80_02875 [Candidatus ainarchaeum sp.]|nr:hypothetical protein [Candidatus ainarchaeum sp.]MDD5096404.1 hypothetical protein [Candidatus ainarchaeum sp.]